MRFFTFTCAFNPNSTLIDTHTHTQDDCNDSTVVRLKSQFKMVRKLLWCIGGGHIQRFIRLYYRREFVLYFILLCFKNCSYNRPTSNNMINFLTSHPECSRGFKFIFFLSLSLWCDEVLSLFDSGSNSGLWIYYIS